MKTEDMISATEFCIHHNIELAFIHSLSESGLIELIIIEEKIFLPINELSQLEKWVRLHVDMDINIEGIETIHHLLQRVNTLQEQIVLLKNKLQIFEK